MSCTQLQQRYTSKQELVREKDSNVDESQFAANLPTITAAELKKIAIEHGGYETPALNDNLYLHYKGYRKIENLEAYVNLKALWLDSNGFQKIENLSHLANLRCLYLQRNLISRIENLSSLESLVQLDLSENRITTIDGLSSLPNLSTVNVAKNSLSDGQSISHLADCKAIKVIDFSHNDIQGDDVVEILSRVQGLTAINMVGNPVVSDLPHFRKKCIVALKGLKYLDRPVFDIERSTAEAWSSGGREAELETKKQWQQKEKDAERRGIEDFRAWQADIRAKAEKERREAKENGPSEKQMTAAEEKERRAQERKEAAVKESESERQRHLIPVVANDKDGLVEKVDLPVEQQEDVVVEALEDDNKLVAIAKDEIEVLPEEIASLNDEEEASEPAPISSSKDLLVQENNAPITCTDTNKVAQETSDYDLKELESVIGQFVPNEELDDERRALVQESVAMYQAAKGATDSTVAAASERSCSQAECDAATDPSTLEPPSFAWNESIDILLAKAVHATAFDFEETSKKMVHENPCLSPHVDAEACRLRWSLLDAVNQKKDGGSSKEKPVPREFKVGSLLSFEDLQRRALSERSTHLTPPVLPDSHSDGEDEDEDEVCRGVLARDEIWASLD